MEKALFDVDFSYTPAERSKVAWFSKQNRVQFLVSEQQVIDGTFE
jgi:hypothetical protein